MEKTVTTNKTQTVKSQAEQADVQQPLITLAYPDYCISLLGTAHVSRASAEKVRELLQTGEYSCVAVELCPNRYQSLTQPENLANMDLFKVIREGKVSMVMASLALSAYQQRLAEEFGIEPGAEMRMAIDQAKSLGYEVVLIDRDIGITLKRVYHNVPWWKKMMIVSGLMASVISTEKISEEEIEKLKEGDILETTFAQFAAEEKDLFQPLIDERDQFMALSLQKALLQHQPHHILAVVGAGHLKGIARYLRAALDAQTAPRGQKQQAGQKEHSEYTEQKESKEANRLPDTHMQAKTNAQEIDEHTALARINEQITVLEQLPKTRKWLKYLPWLIVALIVFGFVSGFQKSQSLGWQMVMDWVLINGSLSALGAVLARAHPLTIITAFVAAPITSLNPMIGAGMVTSAVELWLRKPNVGDFSALRADTTRIKGWWKNKVARTFLVFFFSSMGSAIGTYVAGFRIFHSLL